ncbi:MAG: protease modulator HflC [Alphaproteobacteria bacterium]|nr:protease modulator HflC [Alphaproteobacteria bacterium]
MAMLKTIGGIAAAAVVIVGYMSAFVVDERERALVVRFGEINRIIDKPGLYFKLPVAEDVVTIEDRIVIWESFDKGVQVVDGRRYLVDAVTVARISDSQRFRETVAADLARARMRIETRLDAALRQTYGRRTFEAALSRDRDTMMKEIRDQVRGEAAALGIDIVDVRIRRTDLMPDVLKDTYNRMSSERNAEAADLRSKGEATKTRMNAETDRTVTEKLAAARREAEIIRGQGDAERNKVFAEAFQKDPEFFGFYRSMQAYAKSLTGQGTTMVLNPDSEFFKYFGTQTKSTNTNPAQ